MTLAHSTHSLLQLAIRGLLLEHGSTAEYTFHLIDGSPYKLKETQMDDRNKMENQGNNMNEDQERGGNTGEQKKPSQGSQQGQQGQQRQGEQGEQGGQQDRERKEA
jgi:hypothetical protein